MEHHAIQKAENFSIRKVLPTLIALIFGMLVVILDTSVMNVAIPKLEITFHTSLATIQWAVTGYTLALSAVIPLAGWFSDRYGAKRVFLLSITLFMAGSLLCSISAGPAQLIVFRILQGLGGGMVAPIGLAFSFRVAPPEKRGSIMGLLGLPMLIAPVMGPLISGWLLEYASWRSVFLINVPVGIVALALGVKCLPNVDVAKRIELDAFGAVMAPLSFAMLIYGVHNGGDGGWGEIRAVAPIVVGVISLCVFIVIELRRETPLLELRAFRNWEFSKGVIIAFVNWMAIFGALFLIPIYLQQVRGFSTFHSGLMIVPQAVMSFAGLQLGGKWFDQHGARPVVLTGLTTLSVALYFLSHIAANTSVAVVVVELCLLGLGQGLTTMQISTHVLKSTPVKLISRVTPITTSGQQIFGSFAVALMSGILVSHRINHGGSTRMDSRAASVIALVHGFDHTFLVAMAISLCGLALSLFLRRPNNGGLTTSGK